MNDRDRELAARIDSVKDRRVAGILRDLHEQVRASRVPGPEQAAAADGDGVENERDAFGRFAGGHES